MNFGELHIEGGKVRFFADGKERVISCKDIVWAYHKDADDDIVFHTRSKNKYQFEMSKVEARECLNVLKQQNPKLMIGCSQRGGRLPMNSLDNTRDLGSMQTRDGQHILPGRLLRSGDLYHASYEDQNYLRKKCNLKQVIDFRAEKERKERPDVVIHGAEYIGLPIMDEKSGEMLWEENMLNRFAHFQGDAEVYMVQFYEKLVLDRKAQHAYGEFFRFLKYQREGATLWHCALGKDRAGVATALLLYILGVHPSAILEDYMCSGDCLGKDIESALRLLENWGLPRRALKNAEVMLSAKETYMQHAFEKILEKYKTIDKYIKRAIGLTAFDINFLRDKYLF